MNEEQRTPYEVPSYLVRGPVLHQCEDCGAWYEEMPEYQGEEHLCPDCGIPF